MPRLRNCQPERDGIKALILERQKALNLSNADLAVRMRVSEATLCRLKQKHTREWKLSLIEAAARTLGITKTEIKEAWK